MPKKLYLKYGKTLIEEGDTNNKSAYIIERGEVGIFKGGKDGLANFYMKNGMKPNYQELLNKWANNKIAAKGFTTNQTREANKWFREYFVKKIVKHTLSAKTPKEFAKRADTLHKLFQMQVNISEGLMKGTNTIRYLTLEAPTSALEIKRRD